MQVPMRFSPTKTTILMKKNPAKSWKPSEEDYARKKEDDLMEHAIGINTRKTSTNSKAQYQADENEDLEDRVIQDGDILVDDYGRPLVNRESAFLPDPRYREGAHLIFCLLWYGGCLGAIAYIIFVFATYTPEQTQTFPFTSKIDPYVNLRLEVSCSGSSLLQLRTNYSSSSSKCYGKAPTRFGEEDGGGGMAGLPLDADQTKYPSPVEWLNLDAKYPLVTTTAPTSGTNSLQVPVCFHQDLEVFDAHEYWPNFPGTAVLLGNVSFGQLCTIDIYPAGNLVGAGSTSEPLKRISVEGGLMKTVWLKYTEKRLKHEDKKLESESINVDFYELDVFRDFVPGFYPTTEPNTTGAPKNESTIIRFRLMDTSAAIMEYDMRSWVNAGGIFGSLWYLISNYFCFYAAPLLLCVFPRDFIADTKNGKLDGYTLNGLADAWKPTVWLWIGGELVKRVKFATS